MKARIFFPVFTFIWLMSFSVLFSQPGAGPCFKTPANPKPFMEIEGLTDDQKTSIESLREQFRSEMRSIRESGDFSRDEIRDMFLLKRDGLHKQIEDLLTPEQIEQMRQQVQQYPLLIQNRQIIRTHERFADEKVRPAILKKRSEFENLLTEEEKQVIEAIRIKVNDHREMMRNLKPGVLTPDERRQIRDQHINELQPLRDIAQKYKAELNSIYRESGIGKLPPCNFAGTRSGTGHFRKSRSMEQGASMPAVRFLLIEPAEFAAASSYTVSDDIRIFPNPVVNGFSIDFELMEEAVVSIELLSNTGEVVGLLDHTNRGAGPHTFSSDGELLEKRGIYFIRIKTPDTSMIAKLIKN